MSSEFLTQDEVDALLTGVDGVAASPVAPERVDSVRSFDALAQDPALRGRMTGLEAVNERFRRLLRAGLFNFMGRVPEISAGPVRPIKYADFTAALLLPANLNVVQIKPLPGSALIAFEPALIYLIVDALFGGDGRFQPQPKGRDYTPTEQAIVRRMLGVIFAEYEKAWSNLQRLAFEFVRSEWTLQLAHVAEPSDIVIATTFTIECGAASGAFHVCVPYTTFEPIRALLYGNGERKEVPQPDEHWLRTMSNQVHATEVDLIADLVSLPVTVQQVLNMSVGDVLGVDIPKTVKAQVDGVPLFDCRYGTLNGQYALRIASALIPGREPFAGEHHAQ